jgi:hypothetical protein
LEFLASWNLLCIYWISCFPLFNRSWRFRFDGKYFWDEGRANSQDASLLSTCIVWNTASMAISNNLLHDTSSGLYHRWWCTGKISRIKMMW